MLPRVPVYVTVEKDVAVVFILGVVYVELDPAVTYAVRLYSILVPEVIAELSAAPADGDEVIFAAAPLVADALMADDISLATDDATTVASVVVCDVDGIAVTLYAWSLNGMRILLLRLSSPGR